MKVRGETSNEEDGEKVRKRRGQGEREMAIKKKTTQGS